jgi:hypothetical protein
MVDAVARQLVLTHLAVGLAGATVGIPGTDWSAELRLVSVPLTMEVAIVRRHVRIHKMVAPVSVTRDILVTESHVATLTNVQRTTADVTPSQLALTPWVEGLAPVWMDMQVTD